MPDHSPAPSPAPSTSLRVRVTDDIFHRLQQRAEDSHQPLEQVLDRLVAQAVKLMPERGRVVVVTGSTLTALEQILGGGSVLHEADLLLKVERLAGVSFLHCRLPFTPNQLEALAEKASRNSLSVEQLIERTAPRIYEHFFDLVERA